MKSNNVRKLTESAVMLAVATVLSMIPIIEMPFGGKLTLVSMLPILLIAYRYGISWGFLVSFTYGIIQMMLGLDNLSYATNWLAGVAIVLLDYLVAYGVLGFAGLFRKKLNNQRLEISLGIAVGCVLRFVCHFITGVTVWSVWAKEGMPVWLYSMAYNGLYMLPEMVLSIVVAIILASIFDLTSEKLSPIRKSN